MHRNAPGRRVWHSKTACQCAYLLVGQPYRLTYPLKPPHVECIPHPIEIGGRG